MRVGFPDEVTSDYDSIVVQPHFDDAVLSCGGILALERAARRRTLVITVFGGPGNSAVRLSAFGIQVHREMGFGTSRDAVVASRRREDAAACGTLGADYCWLDFPEALYRSYTDYAMLFGAAAESDAGLRADIGGVMSEVMRRAPCARVYAPLGAGGHVDHRIVSAAVREAGRDRASFSYYEEFPYATVERAAQRALDEFAIPLCPELADVTAVLPAKVGAILCYRSQIHFLLSVLMGQPTIGDERERLGNLVERYASSLGPEGARTAYERCWVPGVMGGAERKAGGTDDGEAGRCGGTAQ